MNITYSAELKDHMQKKGLHYIEVGVADARTCCSGFSELLLDFVSDKGYERIKDKVVHVLPGEVGEVLVTARGLEYDEDIRFDLKGLFGIKDIQVKGIRPWSI